MRIRGWQERVREVAERFQTARVEVLRLTGGTTAFDPVTNTGGEFETVAVYEGPARIQQITVNRDREGMSYNPTSEVGVRIQLRRDEGWADDFENPQSYDSPKGDRKVLKGWTVVVTDGGDNTSLEDEVFYVDSALNSNFIAVVDLVCTNVLEAERG